MSEEPNSVMSSLTNSPVTPDAKLTGSNENTNIETLSPCNCPSALLNINSSKNDILKVEAQLSALKKVIKLRTVDTKESNRIFYWTQKNVSGP